MLTVVLLQLPLTSSTCPSHIHISLNPVDSGYGAICWSTGNLGGTTHPHQLASSSCREDTEIALICLHPRASSLSLSGFLTLPMSEPLTPSIKWMMLAFFLLE